MYRSRARIGHGRDTTQGSLPARPRDNHINNIVTSLLAIAFLVAFVSTFMLAFALPICVNSCFGARPQPICSGFAWHTTILVLVIMSAARKEIENKSHIQSVAFVGGLLAVTDFAPRPSPDHADRQFVVVGCKTWCVVVDSGW